MNKRVMETVTFVVDEKPYAVSDWNLKKKNIDFLEGIDPKYFSYIAATNLEKLTGVEQHYAALSLRISYYQALETFFALLASTVQSPTCPLGWMMTYQNSELRSVVQKISLENDIYSRLNTEYITWDILAHIIHKHVNVDEVEKKHVSESFGVSWRALASDFLDNNHKDEYNSAKHGLRVKSGGFFVSIGKAEKWGVSAPPEKMAYLGGSHFGTSFFVKTMLSEKDKVNFRPRRLSINWHPQNLLYGLELIATSINNVLSFLKLINGVQPSQCNFLRLDDDHFEKPWEECVDVPYWNADTVLKPEHVHLFSKEEVINSYSK